ncbi:MAG: PEP-CTERM sorting domain-containing protein [Crocosphaera sp.]
MNRLTKLALGTVAASTGLMVAYAPAQAALLGDEVNAELLFDGSSGFNQTATVIDPGVEFTAFSQLALDVKNDSFDLIYDLSGLGGINNNTTWVLSDLDWVDTPGIITGVTLTSGDANVVTGTSFTDNSITVDLSSYTIPPQNSIETWSFDIETSKVSESVPEPGTILGLLTIAGLGFGSRLKRKI